ncbi:MAG TPA: ATP-binding cassette domain-containing protein [Virgibacillus sp.]|nr:ATP-binding cassette domain-containing protein [Virgibacillus sp.]
MITIKDLRKKYQVDTKDILAVDQLNLSIPEGQIFGVIGYSGAGKSTFVRLLNRLEEPTSGSVTIDDQEITSLTPEELRLQRQEIGMIFQHFNLLWSRTVKQNIQFPLEIAGVGKEEREERAKELIRLVGLSDRENAYPSQLSGGQKQRVGIARALANNPKVLLCDEATSALDPDTTNAILDLLVDINQKLGLTIILITHEMHVIRKICHQVAVMENGKIVEQGDVLDIFLHPKENVTKKFVEQVMGQTNGVDEVLANMPEDVDGQLAQLHFVGEKTNQTLISTISKKFPADVNILQGNITQTQRGAYGTLIVQFVGEKKVIEQVIAYVKEAPAVEIEVIANVL